MVDECGSLVQAICDEHVFAAEAAVRDEELRKQLIVEVQNECAELIEYVAATKRFHLEVNSRSKDRVVSFGEKLSCRFMAVVLRDAVCAALPLSRGVDLPGSAHGQLLT